MYVHFSKGLEIEYNGHRRNAEGYSHNLELNRVEQSRTAWSGSIIGKINHTTSLTSDYFFDQPELNSIC